EEATKNALRARLQEVERADELQREAIRQQPRFASEPQQAVPSIPAHVHEWLNQHPQYVHDAIGQAELNVATMKCVRDGKTWDDADFIPALERHLNIKPAQANGSQPQQVGQSQPIPPRHIEAAPAPPRNPPPIRQQQ